MCLSFILCLQFDMNNNNSSIDIYLINYNYGLVFNPDHIDQLRQSKIRLCGHLIGTLANNNYQINEFGAPLLLTNEEIKLLNDLKTFEIKCYTSYEFDDDIDVKMEYKKYLDNFYKQQNLSYKLKRTNEVNSMKTKIINGKRKSISNKICELNKKEKGSEDKLSKLKAEFDSLSEESLNIEINDLNINDINTEIFLQIPEFLKKQYKFNNFIKFSSYLSITSDIDYKYVIYKYLWSLGYYLTSNACKFGGDYLVYQGDPYQFHSKYILSCLNEIEFKNIRVKQLIHYGRIATNVKKSYLIACVVKNNDNILLTCINWSHI